MKMSGKSIYFKQFSMWSKVMESKAVEKSVDSSISGLPSLFA